MIVNSKKKPSYKLISTYKTELMGVASISVLIGHAGTAIIADTGAISLIPKIATIHVNFMQTVLKRYYCRTWRLV